MTEEYLQKAYLNDVYLESVYFATLLYPDGGTGFTNQILSLVSSIIRAIIANKKAVAIDAFGMHYGEKTKQTNISNIIDLKKTNEFLKKNYNIVLLDKNTMMFKVNAAYFGIITEMVNITNEISTFISKKDNSLFIPKSTIFNKLKGDPSPGKKKVFILSYSLDEYNFVDCFPEYLTSDITSNVSSECCKHDFKASLYFLKNMSMFNDILTNIKFTHNIIPRSLLEDNMFKNYDKVNVIHLRLEEDALLHWGKQNKMTTQEFQIYLENKYIDLIKKNIQKRELNIILSYSDKNAVFDFLENNGFLYLFVKKDITKCHRELDAIHDLFLSTKCNNIFIGNFSMKNMQGSSFSYYILQKLEHPNVKKICINLDNIKEQEEVFY